MNISAQFEDIFFNSSKGNLSQSVKFVPLLNCSHFENNWIFLKAHLYIYKDTLMLYYSDRYPALEIPNKSPPLCNI